MDTKIFPTMKQAAQLLFLLLFAQNGWAQFAPVDTLPVQFGDKTHLPAKIAQTAKQGNHLFAGGPKGIWRSDDEGQTWEKKFTGNIVALAASDSAVVATAYRYWVTYNPSNGLSTSYHAYDLWVSPDGGENFTQKLTKQGYGSLFTSENYSFRHLLVKNDSTFFFYLTYATWGDTDGIWIWSEDAGQTWQEQETSDLYFDAVAVSNDTVWGVKKGATFRGLTNAIPTFNWDIPNLGQGPAKLLTAFYKNGFLYAQYESGHVLRSTDGSFNWDLTPGLHLEKLTGQPGGIFKTTDAAVLRADNAELSAWTSVWDFSALPNTRPFLHHFSALDGISVAQTAGGFLNISTDDQTTWQPYFGIPSGGDYMPSFHYFAGKYWVNAFDGALLTSGDFYDWQMPDNSNYLEIMELEPSKSIMYKEEHDGFLFAVAGTGKRLLRTTDGISWEPTGLSFFTYPKFVFQSLGGRLYILPHSNNAWKLFSSDDNFTTYEEKTIAGQFISFAVSGNNWLAVSKATKQLVRSQDEGVTWDTLLNGIEFQGISAKSDGTLLALTEETETAVWRSTDGGISWGQSGLPPQPIEPGSDHFDYDNIENDILRTRHRQFVPNVYVEVEVLLSGNDGGSYTSIGLPPWAGVPSSNFMIEDDRLFFLTPNNLWASGPIPDSLLFSFYPKDTSVLQTMVCGGDIVGGIPITADTVLSDWVKEGTAFHLTINQISVVPFFESQFHISLCGGGEAYNWNGEVYTAPGEYEQIFQTLNGCDSIVTLFLDYFQNNIFDLTATLCEGESILINGNIYDENNPIGTEIFPNAAFNGCDSTANISLSFLPNYEIENNIELIVGDTFNGTPIFSDTVFIENLIAENGCDSTVITDVSVITFTNNFFEKEIKLTVFPNPTIGELFIGFELNEAIFLEIKIVDILGRGIGVVSENAFFQKGKNTIQISTHDWPAGTLFLQIKSEGQTAFRRIIKIN